MVILGDFNFPKINWHKLSGDSAAAALFCEFVFDNDLDQLVTEPTHYQGNTLDFILPNCSRIVHDVKAHKKSCIPTDHFIISFSIQTPVLPSSRSKSQGPLLFIIYINDLPVVIQHSTILLFADDTKCAKLVASQSEYLLRQNDLDSLDTWRHTWNLPFNENKFRFLQFSANASKDPHPHHYSIKGHNITPATSHKDLGILFTNTLNWVEHYNLMTSKAYRQLGLLRRTFSSPNISARKKP